MLIVETSTEPLISNDTLAHYSHITNELSRYFFGVALKSVTEESLRYFNHLGFNPLEYQYVEDFIPDIEKPWITERRYFWRKK